MTYIKLWLAQWYDIHPKSQHTGAEAEGLLLLSYSKILSTPAPPHPKKERKEEKWAQQQMT